MDADPAKYRNEQRAALKEGKILAASESQLVHKLTKSQKRRRRRQKLEWRRKSG